MRISDWSSDVCSSDLVVAISAIALATAPASAQNIASPKVPTPVAAPATVPVSRPPVRHVRVRRPINPNVARVAAANRAATQEPQRQAFMNAVQVFPFADGAIYQVYTAPGAVTDIALQPGENLVAVAAGDTVRWVIGDTTSGRGAEKRTHILVKPCVSKRPTNLVGTTDRRQYTPPITRTTRTPIATPHTTE